jgi:hypothetical protein
MSVERFSVRDSRDLIDAMENKRARVEVAKSFADIDLNDVQLKAVKVRDSDAVVLFANLANEPVFRFNLTPNGSCPVIFGFDTSGKFEQPSFLTGSQTTKFTESLGLRIGVEGEQLAFLKQLDAKYCEALKMVDARLEWQPIVTHNELHKNDFFKVRVVLKGNLCTNLKVFGEEILPERDGHSWSPWFPSTTASSVPMPSLSCV